MKSAKKKSEEDVEVKMELKYCERCGALGTRQSGSGEVYCDHCLLEVAELPPTRKGPRRAMLPVQPHTVMECYEIDEDEDTDFDAAGGAA